MKSTEHFYCTRLSSGPPVLSDWMHFLVIFLIWGCQGPGDQFQHTSQPLLLLELEQTTLLATEVASDLDEPWELLWAPDGYLWYTAHKGAVVRVDPKSGESSEILKIADVHYERSRGLLSMAVHPNFLTEPYVYLHYTYLDAKAEKDNVLSRLVRYTYHTKKEVLTDPVILLDKIPGHLGHNGSRMVITPDKKLLMSTGDIGRKHLAQDANVLPGKILRINLDGTVPADNPIPGSYVYSVGHRNAQGLVVAGNHLYSSEHGPNNDDEINLIRAGQNYGWPKVEGFCDRQNELAFCEVEDVTEPLIAWTPTIAPAGIDYYDHSAIPEWRNSLLLTTLKGRSLRVLPLNHSGEKILDEKIYLQRHFGRIRDLCVAPNGDIYLATSNTDWHPKSQVWMYTQLPKEGDDRIIRLSVIKDQSAHDHLLTLQADSLPMQLFDEDYEITAESDNLGEKLFVLNCATCHLPNGKGVAGSIPPLQAPGWVADKEKLISTTLQGLSDEIVVNGVVYSGIMPGYAVTLTDREISVILNFIRTELNQYEDLIETKMVTDLRRELNL